MGVHPDRRFDIPRQRHGELSVARGNHRLLFPFFVAALLLPLDVEGQTLRWNDRPELRAGTFRIALTARLQIDAPSSAGLDPDSDGGLDVRRRRIGFEGRVTRGVEFELDFETTDPDDKLRDAFVNVTRWRALGVMAGRFKIPFSLDENTSSGNLDLAERSLAASALAPGRDAGVMAHGRLRGSVFRYEVGLFAHDGENAKPGPNSTRVTGGRTLAWRAGIAPFNGRQTILSDLLVSVGRTESTLEEGFSGVRGETAFGADFYDSDFWVSGPRDRTSLEIRWRPGPASIKSELIRVIEARQGQSVGDTDLSPLRARGWYISGTWALTGEEKADGLPEPRRPLFQGGPGAIEVAARVEDLRFDSTATGEPPSSSARADVILGNANRVVTFGVNWYLNRWIRMQFNVLRERLTDPSQGPEPSQPSFWSRVWRVQFSL